MTAFIEMVIDIYTTVKLIYKSNVVAPTDQCLRVFSKLQQHSACNSFNFPCAEPNANELEQRILLIYIRFGAWEEVNVLELTIDHNIH